MPTVAILGQFPDEGFEENLVETLRNLEAEVWRLSPNQPAPPLQSALYDSAFIKGSAIVVVVFSSAYQDELQSSLQLERELIVNCLQSSPERIVPIFYEENFVPRGIFSSLQMYDVRKLGLTLLVSSLRERFETATPSTSNLVPHPRISSALKEGFPGKQIESLSGPVMVIKDNIGYELFKISDRDFGSVYVAHTYNDTTISATAKHLKDNFNFVNPANLLLIANRNRNAPNEPVRLQNLKNALGAKQAWYVDTFIAERLGWPPDSFLSDIPNPKPYFVEPRIKPLAEQLTGTLAIPFLEKWQSSGPPILVVQGQGGIGKTQLLRQFAKYISTRSNVTTVYLDSISILEHFQDGDTLFRRFDIETLSTLIGGRLSDGPVSAERLLTLMTSERFLIILDGLDEVIPRLPTGYDVTDFFASIQKVSQGLEGGRLLISCRNSFWDPLRVVGPIGVAELEAFDDAQVESYLANRFPDSPSDKRRAKLLIAEMQRYFANEIYPFILDLACVMSASETPDQPLGAKNDQEGKVFDDGQVLDDVIWHVCRREAAKFGGESGLRFEDQPLDVPLQARLLNELALQMSQLSGQISLANAKAQLAVWLGGRASDAIDSAFRSHPLLDPSDGFLRFRYDFVQEFFLAVALKQTICGEREISASQALFLTSLCRLESNFLKLVARKVGSLTEEVTIGISDLKDSLKSSAKRDEWKAEISVKAIGGATNIGLQCLISQGKWDSELGSAYLVDLFGTKGRGELEGLVLLAPNSEINVIFSFENLIVRDSTIQDYDNFLRCKFNSNTKFVRCIIFGGNFGDARADKTATAANFDDGCRIDERIREKVRAKDDKIAATADIIEKTLKSYLKIFRTSGTFHKPKKLETLQGSVTFPTKIPFSAAIDALFEADLMVDGVGKGGKFVGINGAAVSEVEDFVDQGVQGPRIRAAIQGFRAL